MMLGFIEFTGTALYKYHCIFLDTLAGNGWQLTPGGSDPWTCGSIVVLPKIPQLAVSTAMRGCTISPFIGLSCWCIPLDWPAFDKRSVLVRLFSTSAWRKGACLWYVGRLTCTRRLLQYREQSQKYCLLALAVALELAELLGVLAIEQR